jgi:hypothetical protein
VYSCHRRGLSAGEITRRVSRRYANGLPESGGFVTRIISGIQQADQPVRVRTPVADEPAPPPEPFDITRQYLINGQCFRLHFADRRLESLIHSSFAHLETTTQHKPGHDIHFFTSGKRYHMLSGGKTHSENDAGYLKRALFVELYTRIYPKTEDRWLGFIHGAAVRRGNVGLILTTASGSGKSTLAGLLCSAGFGFVADDILAVDRRSGKLYPFPAGLSVKEGAMEVLLPFFPQLASSEKYVLRGIKKNVRFLGFPADKAFFKPATARFVIFVRYEPGAGLRFEPVAQKEAFRRFLEETWVNTTTADSLKFLRWFRKLEFYDLVYSGNRDAVQAIQNLFTPKGSKP